MPILSTNSIGTTDCDSAPWLALREAEARLTESERAGDPLAVASAHQAVADARQRCGALWAELLLYATDADGVRDLVARRLNALPLVDAAAREHAAAVARAVEDHAGRHLRHQHELWELARAVARIEDRLDSLVMEDANHA